MKPRELLDALSVASKLKDTTRHCCSEKRRPESVAEHCFRASLMAYFLKDEIPDIDVDKVIKMCLIHDLGEAFTGDIPCFDKTKEDEELEEQKLNDWVESLPESLSNDMKALYQEMSKMQTKEAKLFKCIDGLEAVISHNESPLDTWIETEYTLNQTYAADRCEISPFLVELRALLKEDTIRKLDEHN